MKVDRRNIKENKTHKRKVTITRKVVLKSLKAGSFTHVTILHSTVNINMYHYFPISLCSLFVRRVKPKLAWIQRNTILVFNSVMHNNIIINHGSITCTDTFTNRHQSQSMPWSILIAMEQNAKQLTHELQVWIGKRPIPTRRRPREDQCQWYLDWYLIK